MAAIGVNGTNPSRSSIIEHRTNGTTRSRSGYLKMTRTTSASVKTRNIENGTPPAADPGILLTCYSLTANRRSLNNLSKEETRPASPSTTRPSGCATVARARPGYPGVRASASSSSSEVCHSLFTRQAISSNRCATKRSSTKGRDCSTSSSSFLANQSPIGIETQDPSRPRANTNCWIYCNSHKRCTFCGTRPK